MQARALSSIAVLVVLGLITSSCGPRPESAATIPPPTLAPTETVIPLESTATPTAISSATAVPSPTTARTATPVRPTATPVPLAPITLKPGSRYFEIAGKPAFLFSRNLTGKTQADFDTLLDWASKGKSKLIRLHLTHGWWGDPWITKSGSVNDVWARDWERFFEQARAQGIYVIPVFGVWADWNNGTPDLGSPLWQYNPLNAANGGPVQSPRELFQAGSPTQRMWLEWVKTLVARWRTRDNIAAWEIFSEVNIASGGTAQPRVGVGVDVEAGIELTNRAAAVIREADPSGRPLTASLAEMYPQTDPWAEYYNLKSLDFVEVHPYSDQLDRELISVVRRDLERYDKPVLIGESGLYSLGASAKAHIGIEHAIWAGLVSGAMNGRGLWDIDGYAIYSVDRTIAFQYMEQYATIERPVAAFLQDVDLTGYAPLPAQYSDSITGAAIGNDKSAIGWFRDAGCEPPNWNLQPVISNATVTLSMPGSASNWRVDFYDTKSGTPLAKSITVTRKADPVVIPLPDLTNDIAFKMYAVPPAP